MGGIARRLDQPWAAAIAACVTILLAGCGGGGDEVIVLADQGPRFDYRGVDTADMNRDGLADIVVASRSVNHAQDQGYIDLYLQDMMNPGNFVQQRFPIPAFPTYVKVADLNRDGLPDVVATMRFASEEFVVLMNNAMNPGELVNAQQYPTTAEPGHVDVGDIDQDGFVDIVLAGEEFLVVHRQNAGGGFGGTDIIGPGIKTVAVADLNQDGVPDVVTVDPVDSTDGDVMVYLNRTNMPGAFQPPVTIRTSISLALGQVATGDLDNDGFIDIAAGGFDATPSLDFFGSWFSIRHGMSNPPTFSIASRDNTPSWIWSIEIADLNGDGRDDVVVGDGTAADPHRVHVYLQSATGTFGNGDTYRLPDVTVSNLELYAISAADLNGDLLPDLAVGNKELFVLFQDPGAPGTFNAPTTLATQR